MGIRMVASRVMVMAKVVRLLLVWITQIDLAIVSHS